MALKLRRLTLMGLDLKLPGANLIRQALTTSTALQYVDCSWNNMGSEGLDVFIDALKASKTLTFLNLSRNCLGPSGGKRLVKGLKDNAFIKSLHISGNNFGPHCSDVSKKILLCLS